MCRNVTATIVEVVSLAAAMTGCRPAGLKDGCKQADEDQTVAGLFREQERRREKRARRRAPMWQGLEISRRRMTNGKA